MIVATNLFRDQLDRYGEADAVVDRWAAALATAAAGSVLVYCADDPRLAMLASEFDAAVPIIRPRRHADRPTTGRLTADDMIADPVSCPACGRQLLYAWRSIGHLGASPARTATSSPRHRTS